MTNSLLTYHCQFVCIRVVLLALQTNWLFWCNFLTLYWDFWTNLYYFCKQFCDIIWIGNMRIFIELLWLSLCQLTREIKKIMNKRNSVDFDFKTSKTVRPLSLHSNATNPLKMLNNSSLQWRALRFIRLSFWQLINRFSSHSNNIFKIDHRSSIHGPIARMCRIHIYYTLKCVTVALT